MCKLLKIPLLCCSGCMKQNCKHRLPYFQAPCISWRKFSNVEELYPFECSNGNIYFFPKKHCAFCGNCTDIFFDYTNGPYMFSCDLGCESWETCGNFIEEG